MSRNLIDPAISKIRCAIYTRKSTEERLDQEFNSLDAQREASEAFIASQKAEGWVCSPRSQQRGRGSFTEKDPRPLFCPPPDKEMLFAAFGKDPGILQSLLEQGGNPSAQGPHGSCLVRAFNSRKSVEQKIGMLLDHGADVNREDPPYKVLVCCLRHGLNPAPRIIDLSNREVLESFIAWSESEVFDQYVADCDVRWADEFLGLVNDSLHG